jgi:hypothetical protein
MIRSAGWMILTSGRIDSRPHDNVIPTMPFVGHGFTFGDVR